MLLRSTRPVNYEFVVALMARVTWVAPVDNILYVICVGPLTNSLADCLHIQLSDDPQCW